MIQEEELKPDFGMAPLQLSQAAAKNVHAIQEQVLSHAASCTEILYLFVNPKPNLEAVFFN